MPGLFHTPQDIVASETQARLRSDPRVAVRGSLFDLGFQGGNALQRGISGTDTRSPVQKRAAVLQGLARQVDFNDPQSIQQGMNAMNQAGFQAEAFKLASLLPGPVSTKVTAVGSPFLQTIQDPTNPGNFVIQKFQNMSDGTQKSIGTALSNEGATADSGLPSGVFGGISIKDEDATNVVARLAGLPEFKAALPGMSTGPEGLEPFIGEIKSVATQMKSEDLNRMLPAFSSGQMSKDQMQLLFGPIADQRYLRAGFSTWIQGGGFDKSVDEGIGGANITPRGDVDTTALSTLTANEAFADDKMQAMDKVGLDDQGNIKGLVISSPRGDGFRLSKMNPATAAPLFSQIASISNDDMRKVFENQGFTFSPQVYASHAKIWDDMRENQGLVNQYLSQLEFPTQAASFRFTTIKDFTEGHDAQGLATASVIFKYLERIGASDSSRPSKIPSDFKVEDSVDPLDLGA